jgi:hypothetical protein
MTVQSTSPKLTPVAQAVREAIQQMQLAARRNREKEKQDAHSEIEERQGDEGNEVPR